VGANAARVGALAEENRSVRVSVLVESSRQAAAWKGRPVSVFIDVNPGMDRTGMEQSDIAAIVGLVHEMGGSGVEFRGLHYYDGHVTAPVMEERENAAHRNYGRLMEIVTAVERAGFPVGEVITSGTPAFPCAATYAPFRSGRFVHRASPGTVVYNDTSSLTQLPPEWGYLPAALVVSTVVSHPKANYLTCDAGDKAVSADAGVPTCAVVGRPDLVPLKPSEEHLPIEVKGGARPEIGETLYLIPRHVCPTVNNFDDALIVTGQGVAAIEKVTARGHEGPLHVQKTQRA
jgi:D-serine deaminase-like pyridoxal phosphate-dependent protein